MLLLLKTVMLTQQVEHQSDYRCDIVSMVTVNNTCQNITVEIKKLFRRNVGKHLHEWTNMVKRMFEQPRRADLLAGKQEVTPITVIPPLPLAPISNIDCLSGKLGKKPTPPRKARTFPGAQSFNPLRPSSGEVPRKPYKFATLPPISQIDFLSSRTPANTNNNIKNDKFPISNVPCLNADEPNLRYEDFNDILPSGRVAKKDFGIKPTDSEFIKLCKMNGRTNLLKEKEILNKSIAIGLPAREFKMTQRRTILRSPNGDWTPSDWVKFKVYGHKGQLR